MIFEDFLKNNSVKKIGSNNSLVKTLNSFIEDDLAFLRKTKVDLVSSRRVVIGYYDVLIMVIYNIGLSKCYKIMSRDALLFFLKYLGENSVYEKFNNFSTLKNTLTYNGNELTDVEAKFIIKEISETIKKLRQKYLREYA